jgi:hypothetical protein
MKPPGLALCAFTALSLAACGGSSSKSNTKDLSTDVRDLSERDLSERDLSEHDLAERDLTASTGCTTVSAWPSNEVDFVGTPSPQAGFDFLTAAYAGRPISGSAGLIDLLAVEMWDSTASPATYPTTFHFTPSGNYNSCTGCVTLSGGLIPGGQPTSFYFAVGGSLTITKADRDPSSGSFEATGSDLHLIEWHYDANDDQAVPGGSCYDIGSFSFSGSYSNASDGGTD